MTSRVYFDPAAIADLREIATYIAQDSPERARTFVADLEAHCSQLASYPERGASEPDAGADIRRLIHGNYIVYYHSADERVTVMRIMHGRRDRTELRIKRPPDQRR